MSVLGMVQQTALEERRQNGPRGGECGTGSRGEEVTLEERSMMTTSAGTLEERGRRRRERKPERKRNP